MFDIFTFIAGLASIFALVLIVSPRVREKVFGVRPERGQARTVAAIVYRSKDVLMVKRRGIGESLTWYFPSGTISGSEEPSLRALAEVKEETGVICRFEKKLGERNHPDTNVFMYYMACSYVSGEAKNRDEDENEAVEWVSASKVESRISTDLAPSVKQFLGLLVNGKSGRSS